MAEPLDILDERDPLGVPLIGSLLFHVGIVAALILSWFWLNHRRGETLGDLNPAGGPAYTVSPVHTIPIPQRQATPNPVANDTQSTVRSAPAKQEMERRQIPDRNTVQIPDKFKREAERPQHQQQYQQPAPANQIYSRTRQALSNPMYNMQSGAGQVGIGPNTPLGDNRLGWYAELIRQRIAQNWNTNGLDTRAQRTPAIVSFYIMRDGTVRTPRIVQSSGDYNIDNTALRAVFQSNPLPQLPPQITESYISAQFTFNLR
ncbi:MAG: TonB family protein [Acidobacteriaceae bacterium]|nr:TonB family protein [Acidobacteriaceae bacterium]MBV9309061.1 TonB family protein [Acidobacteriaceae bacterium]MBV9679251.1 TonB family protein [Acidobacteriaceae bacterium]